MRFFLITILFFSVATVQATVCPDPENSSLKWGEIPSPWQENPFSEHPPQAEEGTEFVRANILEYGHIGTGALCTYKSSVGEWSIWLNKPVKLPTRQDIYWIETFSGYICHAERENCVFYY